MKAGDYYEKNSIRNLHFATGNLIIPGSKVARRIILVHIENGIVVEFLKSTKKVQILSL